MRVLLLLVGIVWACEASAVDPRWTTMQALDALDCAFASSVQCETPDRTITVTTTRASGATCIGGAVVGVNEACVSADGLECMASGVGGRTAADVHTVSTAGWPSANFDITLRWKPLSDPSGATRFLLDSGVSGARIFKTSGNALRLDSGGVTLVSGALSWAAGAAHTIRVMGSGTTGTIYRDGVAMATGAIATPAHESTAAIGSQIAGTSNAEGSIALVRVSK